MVEEGLDVSTCNQVISLNELMSVKSFIQMKGRARQLHSKFLFLCSDVQRDSVEQDLKQFQSVIKFMQKIAYLEGRKQIKPDMDIIEQKALPHSEYLEIPETGAKMEMRNAKLFIDNMAYLLSDGQSTQHTKVQSKQN